MISTTIIYIGLLTMAEWLKINAVAILLVLVGMSGSYTAQQVAMGKVETRIEILEDKQEGIVEYKEEFITLKGEVGRMKSDIIEFNKNVSDLNVTLTSLNLTLSEFKGSSSHTKEKLDELQHTQKAILEDVQTIKLKVR